MSERKFHAFTTLSLKKEGSTKVEVQTVNEEKDLGVYFVSDLMFSKQRIKSAAKSRSVLGLV